MTLQEPKVEFVPIEANVFTQTASGKCATYDVQDPTGGGQRCVGTQPEAKDCADWDSAIPYSG